jgi:hypothetical protein
VCHATTLAAFVPEENAGVNLVCSNGQKKMNEFENVEMVLQCVTAIS